MATPASIVDLHLPTLALVGRVNVGKSTLFNKIIKSSLAITSSIAGTTRTRNIAIAHWRGLNFRIIDTGGLTFSDDIPLEREIIDQTEKALLEADVIMYVVDIQAGLLPQERQLAQVLHKLKTKKPILLVANKADSKTWSTHIHDKEWGTLGYDAPIAVSAATGSGVGDMLDRVFDLFKEQTLQPNTVTEYTPIKVALMGKPNVGKSSLFNKLIGEDRVVVSEMPHTTREPHDTLVEIEGEDQQKKSILFIDTAGIRRKTKVRGELETIGIQKSIQTIDRADIVLLVLDATEPVTDQDQQLAGLLREHTKSVILVINKWDTAEEHDDTFRNEVKDLMYKKFPHLSFAPIVFTSAKTGYRVHQIFPLIEQAWQARHTEVSEEELSIFLKNATRKHKPVTGKGVRHPKILGLKQATVNPPRFEMFIKSKTSVHISYVHYLTNRLREKYNFFATPVIIRLIKMKKI